MAALYFHIPFCRKKCIYCDFYSVTNISYLNDFENRIIEELYFRAGLFKHEIIETIYFGGGTPSLMSVSFFENILSHVYSLFKLVEGIEITVEVNPEDASMEYFRGLKNIGINRISIGTQSFDDNLLKTLSRRHTSNESIKSIENAYNAGFVNISADLIYGVPNLTKDILNKQLNLIFKMPLVHLSAYHLTVEHGTNLYKKLLQGKFHEIDDELGLNQYLFIVEQAQKNKFYHYEISNFAIGNYFSKHNSLYWDRKQYLGFGPSAHSFIGNIRQYSSRNIKEYYSNFVYENDILKPKDVINETIMLSLRKKEGIDIAKYKLNFGEQETERLLNIIRKINPEYYTFDSGFIKLTIKGMFVSDNIIAKLFL